MIETFDLAKSFGAANAVAGVSLGLRAGETLVVLGPSGCGKTTLLRLIAGLERPDHGRVLIDSAPVSTPERLVPPHARRIGMIFQDLALWPHMSVLGNITFGLRGRRGQVRAVADSALRQVGLAGMGERLPHQLSGGERQRLAIARALAGERRWLLLDEPFSSLDPLSKRRIGTLLRCLHQDLDLAILYVTHDLHEAVALADRIVLMQSGRLVGSLDLKATGAISHEELLQWYEETIATV